MTQSPRFVVYHVQSTMEVKSYASEHHARSLLAKLKRDKPSQEYAYTTIDNYKTNVVYMVEKTNLMSGQKYMEPSNTPLYLSPASETYWSM